MLGKYQQLWLLIFLSLSYAIEEPCNYLDSLVNYHLTSLPNQIFEAKKVAKKKLGFQVGKSHTQGFSLLTGMVFDITSDWVANNRTLGNLYGDDSSGISSIHNQFNTLGGNGADGTSLFLGLTHPDTLEECQASPEEFLTLVDTWRVLYPNEVSDPEEALLNLTTFIYLSQSNLACLLNFSGEFIEVAKVGWTLELFIKALELKLTQCVFASERLENLAPLLKRRRK